MIMRRMEDDDGENLSWDVNANEGAVCRVPRARGRLAHTRLYRSPVKIVLKLCFVFFFSSPSHSLSLLLCISLHFAFHLSLFLFSSLLLSYFIRYCLGDFHLHRCPSIVSLSKLQDSYEVMFCVRFNTTAKKCWVFSSSCPFIDGEIGWVGRNLRDNSAIVIVKCYPSVS